MRTGNKKAFTMIELVFVIVVIGILSAIAIPRFASTAKNAYYTKAKATLSAVRASLATERQRRILRGDTTNISDLSLSSGGAATNNAFDHFSADKDGVHKEVLRNPIAACSGAQRGCWAHSGTTYSFKFIDASEGTNGQADFVLSNNRLNCASNDANDCKLITR